MMHDIALEDFLSEMKHAPCMANSRESTHVEAFKIDDEDGLARTLGFHAAMLSKVDYFLIKGDQIQLIELSDLEESAQQCLAAKIQQTKLEANSLGVSESELTAKARKRIRKESWASVVNEFNRKWCGSIAVVERLYRKNGLTFDNPEYRLLIICKDATDARILDDLCVQLTGMMGTVIVCNSNKTNTFTL
ncbi:hypothetical protein [Aeromonas veronii]|uniref:hypothetical protein n=1 Tax=Aeromonas veronii TaxID=654 RepID=UPI003D1C1FBC